MSDQVKFYQAIQDDDTVARKGDVIKVDWSKYSDGTPADNLTTGWNYNPFRTNNGKEDVMKEITEEEAMKLLQKVEV